MLSREAFESLEPVLLPPPPLSPPPLPATGGFNTVAEDVGGKGWRGLLATPPAPPGMSDKRVVSRISESSSSSPRIRGEEGTGSDSRRPAPPETTEEEEAYLFAKEGRGKGRGIALLALLPPPPPTAAVEGVVEGVFFLQLGQ